MPVSLTVVVEAALPARSRTAFDGAQRIAVVLVEVTVDPAPSAPSVITTWLPFSDRGGGEASWCADVWLARSCSVEKAGSWAELAAL